jgi:hypothetical protein
MAGLLTEEGFYDSLKNCLEEKKVKNTVVINGWKDNGYRKTKADKKCPSAPEERETREYDFLIVSKVFRTIFHIEVKASCTPTHQQKAAEQLSKGQEFFSETIPFPQEEGWKYVKIMCFGKDVGTFSEGCQDCRNKFILGPDTDLNKWWDEITKDLNPEENISKSKTYVDIMKYLLHQMFYQEMCITDANLTQYTEEKIKKIEGIFLSKHQFNVMHLTTKKVAFTSFYGTGKTTLLKLKAHQVMEENKTDKVVIVVIEETEKDSILITDYRNKFKDCENKPLIRGLHNTGSFILPFLIISFI